MSLDFFRVSCKYPPISNTVFGLCDNEDGSKAYPDLKNRENWIAEVKNDNQLEIVFTAIDKCVINDHEYGGVRRCDGMLTTNQHLYLVELKNQIPPWQSGAIEQLVSTIELLVGAHDLSFYKKKKAFACNKKRERFVVIDNEFNLKLFKQTGFRIDVQAEIIVL